MNTEFKELSIRDSIKVVSDFLKRRKYDTSLHNRVGNIIMFKYNAKDKTKTYDKTPLIIVLRKSKTYTLGFNLHWCPFILRKTFVKGILKLQAKNIKAGKPLDLDYKKIKPLIMKIGLFPVIRLYINARISKKLIKIENDEFLKVASLRAETFCNGKYTADQIWKKVISERTQHKK